MRVLLAENDDTLRDLLAKLLSDHGHVVAKAGGGSEALDLLRECPYEALITDLVMPGMTGTDLLNLAGGNLPPKVIVSTALTKSDVAALDLPREVKVLHKPYEIRDLLALLGG